MTICMFTQFCTETDGHLKQGRQKSERNYFDLWNLLTLALPSVADSTLFPISKHKCKIFADEGTGPIPRDQIWRDPGLGFE